jgi:hypothetical protein
VVTEQYEASPDVAWSLVGDFGGLDKVFDGLSDLVVEGDTRTFTLMGMRITEQLRARDDATRTITYSIVGGIVVDAHQATIHVEPSGDGCAISWSVTAEPEAAQPLFVDAYQRALGTLHARLDVA